MNGYNLVICMKQGFIEELCHLVHTPRYFCNLKLLLKGNVESYKVSISMSEGIYTDTAALRVSIAMQLHIFIERILYEKN
jgi:hypothetical protein